MPSANASVEASRPGASEIEMWGMIEAAPGPLPDGSSRNGHWRLTNAGRSFAMGLVSAKLHRWVYNGDEYPPPAGKTDGGRMMIGDALGKGFDFRELMSAGTDGDAATSGDARTRQAA